jgi:ABC-type branched-subunit amino acid transport system substrate-binding protein
MVFVAGCSSGGSKTAASGGSTATSAAPTGSPLVFGSVTSDTGTGANPQAGDGLAAWASYVNSHGGVIGRPVSVNRCDDQLDVQKYSDCARKVSGDQSVLAIAGSQSRFTGNTGATIFAQAGLALVCGSAASSDEFKAPTGYCLNGGFTSGLNAVLHYLNTKKGVARAALVVPDSAGGHTSATLIQRLGTANGINITASFASVTSPDYLPLATAAIASKPDAVVIGFAPDQELQMLQALQQAGNTKPIATGDASVTATVAKDAAAKGVLVGTAFPPTTSSDPEMKTFVTAMTSAGKAGQIGPSALGGWLAGRVLQKVIETLGPNNVSRASILQYLQSQTVKGVALLPDLSLQSAPKSIPLPALANPTGLVAEIQADGTLRPFEGSSTPMT